MDHLTAIPGTNIAPSGAVAISAIAAAVSAFFSWRSSRRAADAAATALILKFRDQYASNEMFVDLLNLRAWHDKHGSQFEQTWKEKLKQGDKEALIGRHRTVLWGSGAPGGGVGA